MVSPMRALVFLLIAIVTCRLVDVLPAATLVVDPRLIDDEPDSALHAGHEKEDAPQAFRDDHDSKSSTRAYRDDMLDEIVGDLSDLAYDSAVVKRELRKELLKKATNRFRTKSGFVVRKGGGGHGGGGGRGGGGGSHGGDNGGKGGSNGGKGDGDKGNGGKGGSNGNRANDPPPPYSPRDNNGPPPPYSPGTYGNRGAYRNGWNGQYYPYSSYGYGAAVPAALAFSPFFFAGPFGFYGPYGVGGGGRGAHENATVSGLYVNGTKLENDTWVNGTYINETYSDGIYTVWETPGSYANGTELDDNTVVNGTFFNALSAPRKTDIDPNVTTNGTRLHVQNRATAGAHWTWAPVLLAATALLV